MRSPPERSPTRFCWSAPLEVEPRHVLARVDLALAELDRVVAAARSPSRPCSPGRARRAPGRRRRAGPCRRRGARRASGCLLARDHAEERRLAGAVRADHADDAAGRQREGEVLDEQPVAEALLHARRPRRRRRRAAARRGMWISTRSSFTSAPRRAAARRRRAAPSTSRGAPAGSCAPTRARARACGAAPTPASPRRASRACFCSSHDE